VQLKVLGDEPADFRTFIKIPNDFERQQSERTLGRIVTIIAQVAVGLGITVAVVVLYFMRLRKSALVPWRKLFGWSCVAIAAAAVSFVLGPWLPAALSDYPKSISLRVFYGTLVIGMLLVGAFYLGLLTVVFGLAWSFGARAFGEEHLATWLGMPANYYRDAFWVGLGGSAALIGVQRLLGFTAAWWPTMHRELPADFGTAFDAISPGTALIGGALFHGFLAVALLALGGAFIGAELRARWLRLLLFIAVAAASVLTWGSPADFAKEFIVNGIFLAVVVFGIRLIVRFNMLGVFLVVVCTALLSGAVEFLGQPDALYRRNAYLLLSAIVVLLALPLFAWRLRANNASTQTQ